MGRDRRPARWRATGLRPVRGAGATELRLYHAGLAAATDLAAIGSLCSAGA